MKQNQLKTIINKLLLLLIFYFNSYYAQNISVSAYTDSTNYQVGDYIKYTLELKYNKNLKIIFPSVKDSIKVLEFISELKPEKKENNYELIEKHTFIFSKYDSSTVTIPSYKIYYREGNDTTKKFIEVNPVNIVVSTLYVDPQKDIRDIKDPLKIPLNLFYIILIIIVILALVTVGYLGYKYYRKRKYSNIITEPEIKLPPHEIALNNLKKLEEKKLWQQGLVKEYHSEITEIIRRYFEERFNFRALEMTSSEILACLSYIDDGKAIVDISNDFFTNADMVKFAKFQPLPNINEDMMKQAYKIVSDTIPKIEIIDQEEVKNVR